MQVQSPPQVIATPGTCSRQAEARFGQCDRNSEIAGLRSVCPTSADLERPKLASVSLTEFKVTPASATGAGWLIAAARVGVQHRPQLATHATAVGLSNLCQFRVEGHSSIAAARMPLPRTTSSTTLVIFHWIASLLRKSGELWSADRTAAKKGDL